MLLLQILKLLALIILMLPFGGAYYVLKRRKDLIPILPGSIFLFLSFLFSTFESGIIDDHNYFSHIFFMLTGIFFLLGMIYIYCKKDSKQQIEISKKELRR